MLPSAWITGMGAVTPCAWSVEDTWKEILAGRSGIRLLERFPIGRAATKIAGTVPGTERLYPQNESLALRFALRAARDALNDAEMDPSRRSVDLAVVANHGERRLPRDDEDDGLILGTADLARAVADSVGAPASMAPYGTCAGGALAIGTALQLLRAGAAERVLAGGADCLIRELGFFHFCTLYAMSTRDCPPERASRPFDALRDGFVLSEGAGFLVLETEEAAQRRGARPRAILEGFGSSQNAYHIVASPPDGDGPARAIASALQDARLSPEAIDYVNAHGTATRDNDPSETAAIHTVFGEHSWRVPVSSSKSQLGHMMAAAGAVEAVICVKALETGIVPPTINLDERDPQCDLDYVPWQPRPAGLNHVLGNSFGFGGHNACLVLGRVP